MMEARLAKPEEAELAVSWLASTPENMFDPEVLGYPSTLTFAVDGTDDTRICSCPFRSLCSWNR